MNLPTLLHSAETILTFLLIGLLGYYLAKAGWFDANASAMFSRLLTKIVIPVNLFYNIQTAMTREEFLTNASSILMPLASVLLSLLIGAGVARWAKIPKNHRSIFIVCFSVSNTINIGLPVNTALFGEEALPPVLMYYMASTIIFWTICNSLLASDSPARTPAPLMSVTTVKRVFSPSFLAFISGSVLLLANAPMPNVVGNAMKYVGGMVTPVSTMCIGIGIFETGLKNIRINREVLLLCLGRFVVTPLILACLLTLAPVPELTYKVFMIQASLPPPATVALLAIFYRTDARYASVAISFTTLCAMATVPVYMMILG